MKKVNSRRAGLAILSIALIGSAIGCGSSDAPLAGTGPVVTDPVIDGGQGFAPAETVADRGAVLLVIDEDAIDNGNPPNDFSDVEVNDQLADVGLRDQLRFFRQNVGRTIDLFSGEVGDEAFFALTTVPSSWRRAGPTDNGALNFILAGPGLGSPNRDDDREAYLDKIPNVTPLRARGLTMLVGHTVFAVVYDSDVGINYSPLNGSLKGANLGLVALRILDVQERRDGSTGSLPRVTVEILDTDLVRDLPYYLFANAPVPASSGEPYDVRPPQTIRAPQFVSAP